MDKLLVEIQINFCGHLDLAWLSTNIYECITLQWLLIDWFALECNAEEEKVCF